MLIDYTTIICPLPGLGHCVRGRCNFWDENNEECTCDCLEAGGPLGGGSTRDPDGPCIISFCEDYD
jgi:hypothetical protein